MNAKARKERKAPGLLGAAPAAATLGVGAVIIATSGGSARFAVTFLGFAGIAVALLGRNHPAGIAVGALVFAFLDASSGILQNTGSASREIVIIMQGVILLSAVVAFEVVNRIRERDEARQAAEALAAGAQA